MIFYEKFMQKLYDAKIVTCNKIRDSLYLILIKCNFAAISTQINRNIVQK